MAAISGTASAPQAFRGDASSRNKKSGNLASCLLAGGVLFRPLAIRHGVSPGHRGYDTPGSQKAPSAIRCIKTLLSFICLSKYAFGQVRKHRAPKGALRRVEDNSTSELANPSQKAPSTKRCIKTPPSAFLADVCQPCVRKHREPQISHVIPFFQLCTNSQKSQNFNDPTSNVETTGRELRATFLRNHPRPAKNGALRRNVQVLGDLDEQVLESTERHKVH